MTIDQRLLNAYLEYSGEQVRAGILNCARWEEAMLSGKSIEDFMRDELAEAGRAVPE